MGAPARGPHAPVVAHVYAHVPFCARKCPYCDFNSYAGRDDETAAYLEALATEAATRLAGHGVRSLYVGGGTPTHLDAAPLGRLLEVLRRRAGTEDLVEYTVEANPGSLDAEKVRAMRDAGVNRVSLGAQSFDDRHLRTLGRRHEAADVSRSVALLREGGIARLSLDLILAVPGQTLADQERDLSRVLMEAPDHVSAYLLTIEEGTPFAREVRAGRLPAPDDARELGHLRLAVAALEAGGLSRYEVSNFARPGRECLQSLAYWRDADWVGLGAGAHSHVGAERAANVDDPAAYVQAVRARGTAVAWTEVAGAETRLLESLLMGLRLVEGVDLDEIARRTGLDVRVTHAARLEAHVRDGLLVLERGRLHATPRGLELLSWVVRDFVPETGTVRTQHDASS